MLYRLHFFIFFISVNKSWMKVTFSPIFTSSHNSLKYSLDFNGILIKSGTLAKEQLIILWDDGFLQDFSVQ